MCRRQGTSFRASRKWELHLADWAASERHKGGRLRATGCDCPEPADAWVAACARVNNVLVSLQLETQLQSQLNDSRVAIGVCDFSKGRVTEIRVGILKQWMVEDVEELGTKLQAGTIPDLVNGEILEQGKIKIEFARSTEDADTGIAEARCYGWAVPVRKSCSGVTSSGGLLIADDRRRGEATRIDVVAQFGGYGAGIHVLAGGTSAREFRAVRGSSVDVGSVGVSNSKVVSGLEYGYPLDGPTSERCLSESIVRWKLWQLIGIINHQPLGTDEVVRTVVGG